MKTIIVFFLVARSVVVMPDKNEEIPTTAKMCGYLLAFFGVGVANVLHDMWFTEKDYQP